MRIQMDDFDALERELQQLEPAWADFVYGIRTGLRPQWKDIRGYGRHMRK